MMPFHPQFRGLLLKKIPQLTPVILDRYEQLIGLYGHAQSQENHKALKVIAKEAQSILSPVRKQYQYVCTLWYARREFAMTQGSFLQIPTSSSDLIRLARSSIKYHAILLYASIYLWVCRILYHPKRRPKIKETHEIT